MISKAIISVLILSPAMVIAQENLEVYRGNQAYKDGKYDEASAHYQKALRLNPSSYKGSYNSGNASYKRQEAEGAISSYQQAVASSTNNEEKAQALHNLGNAYLQSGKLDEAIKAYKDALRITPEAGDTRYNLAYAQRMKQKQEQQQQQQNNENKDDQQKQDQQQNQEQKDKEQEENKDQQQDQQEKRENEKPQESGAKDAGISEREAEQMLDAVKNDEQKLLMQLSKQRQQAKTKTVEKDW